jgi:hypothetical protein
MPTNEAKWRGAQGAKNVLRPVLAETLGKTVEQSVKLIGGMLLRKVLSAAVLGPGTDIAGAAASTLVKEFLRQTRAQEAKLDVMIAEPLESATFTLREVIAARGRPPAEHREVERRLGYASDNLQKAYTYATTLNHEMCLLIRAYQCVVCALKEGADPFLEAYLEELKAVARSTHDRALALRDDASAIAGIRSYTRGERSGFANVSRGQVKAEQRKAALYQEADHLEDYANDIELFCDFVKRVAGARATILSDRVARS